MNWQRIGQYEYEFDVNGYTGWYKAPGSIKKTFDASIKTAQKPKIEEDVARLEIRLKKQLEEQESQKQKNAERANSSEDNWIVDELLKARAQERRAVNKSRLYIGGILIFIALCIIGQLSNTIIGVVIGGVVGCVAGPIGSIIGAIAGMIIDYFI